ncbi:MAG: aminodeoxychorismate lyase [Burkholderiales bacterium]|nr:aminodeoxychorismate lyase [Burkholderiales bacterium]MDP2398759.1 aminodeoxychorismate lyase [Burkholderiales bacterium]
MLMTLVDGRQVAGVPADDRGLTYGDGVFRTLAVRNGHVCWWPRHYAKLAADCIALDIRPPEPETLFGDIQTITARLAHCALRITVTRGSGGRGYARPAVSHTRRIVSAGPLPDYPAGWSTAGVAVRICDLRLSEQPALAGIKHLGRLENVLARAEWNDPAIAEGLLQDSAGRIVEGTRCNLFLVEKDGLVTPDLSLCGVAGLTRDLVIESAIRHGLRCSVEPIDLKRLESATEVFLVNSLIGVWPVATLGHLKWRKFVAAPLVRKWLDAFENPPA